MFIPYFLYQIIIVRCSTLASPNLLHINERSLAYLYRAGKTFHFYDVNEHWSITYAFCVYSKPLMSIPHYSRNRFHVKTVCSVITVLIDEAETLQTQSLCRLRRKYTVAWRTTRLFTFIHLVVIYWHQKYISLTWLDLNIFGDSRRPYIDSSMSPDRHFTYQGIYVCWLLCYQHLKCFTE